MKSKGKKAPDKNKIASLSLLLIEPNKSPSEELRNVIKEKDDKRERKLKLKTAPYISIKRMTTQNWTTNFDKR